MFGGIFQLFIRKIEIWVLFAIIIASDSKGKKNK